jgi:hypothetical protein
MSGNRGSTIRMDLQLAAYAAGKDVYTRVPTVREMFPRKRITTLMQDNGRLTQVMNNLRHSAHRTQESHNKQVQMYLDRERFQQNASWRAEYDRLASTTHRAPYLQKRMDDLKEVMQIPDASDMKSRLLNK